MRKGLFLALAILLLTLTAYLAHLWLIMLEDSLLNFSPPFEGKLPPDLPTTPVSQKLVLVIAEIGEPDAYQRAGYLKHLMEIGAYAPVIWPDAPGNYTPLSVLLTGASPDMGGVYFTPSPFQADHLLKEAKRAGRTVAFSGPEFWQDMLDASDDFDAFFLAKGDDGEQIAREAARFIRYFHPDFLLVHLGGEAFQQGKPSSHPGTAGLDELVRLIGRESNPTQDILAVLLASGRTSALIIAGKGIKPGRYDAISATDIAPTLAALMGIPIPTKAQGHILFPILRLPEDRKAEKAIALARQRVNLADFYLVNLRGKGLKEGVKGDAIIAQSSFETGNYKEAFELAHLAIKEADQAMAKARERAIEAGQWHRLPLVLIIALLPLIIALIQRRPLTAILFLGGILSVTLNAYLFRQECSAPSYNTLYQVLSTWGTIRRTLIALFVPALLPFLWLLVEGERDLVEVAEALAGYALFVVYLTALPALFCLWRIGFTVTWPLPPLSLYSVQFLSLWQVILTGLAALPLPFLGMFLFGMLKVSARLGGVNLDFVT